MRPKLAPLLAALLVSSVSMLAQTSDNSAPSPPVPRPQFFAGTVTTLNDQQITISRTLVGRSPEHRTFAISSKTKMNKPAVKLRSKVTVKYEHLPQGDVAVEIQLQGRKRSVKPS